MARPNGSTGAPLAERFWNKVQIAAINNCWLWIGATTNYGYGVIRDRGKLLRAPRIMWEYTHGPIPPGLVICHQCDNPACVNLAHLFIGTQSDNMRDAGAKGRLAMQLYPLQKSGENQWQAKMTERGVRNARTRYAAGGITQAALASEFGIATGTMKQILQRRTWKHVP